MGGRADSEKGPRKRDATRGREGGRRGRGRRYDKSVAHRTEKVNSARPTPPSLTPPHGISMQHYYRVNSSKEMSRPSRIKWFTEVEIKVCLFC